MTISTLKQLEYLVTLMILIGYTGFSQPTFGPIGGGGGVTAAQVGDSLATIRNGTAGWKIPLALIPSPGAVSGADTNRVAVYNATAGAWQLGWDDAGLSPSDTSNSVRQKVNENVTGRKTFLGATIFGDSMIVRAQRKAGVGNHAIRMFTSFGGNGMITVVDSAGNRRFSLDSLFRMVLSSATQPLSVPHDLVIKNSSGFSVFMESDDVSATFRMSMSSGSDRNMTFTGGTNVRSYVFNFQNNAGQGDGKVLFHTGGLSNVFVMTRSGNIGISALNPRSKLTVLSGGIESDSGYTHTTLTSDTLGMNADVDSVAKALTGFVGTLPENYVVTVTPTSVTVGTLYVTKRTDSFCIKSNANETARVTFDYVITRIKR